MINFGLIQMKHRFDPSLRRLSYNNMVILNSNIINTF